MSKQESVARNTPRDTSAVGLNPLRRDAMGAAMRVLTRITGSELADRYNLRQAIDRVTYQSTKTGFKTLGRLGDYLLLGAVIVVPVFILIRVLSYRR